MYVCDNFIPPFAEKRIHNMFYKTTYNCKGETNIIYKEHTICNIYIIFEHGTI